MTLVRIAAVSYLNTVPFIYGLRHAGNDLRAELLLSPPAGCTDAIASSKADIALIPVAGIPEIPNLEIIGNHCISACRKVRTVALMSASPLHEIRKIYLDPHSRTSVALIRMLAEEHWKLDVQWETLTDFADVKPEPGAGYTLIGDKVFGYEAMFPYRYDLAEAWNEWIRLPFVFATWVAPRGTDPAVTGALERALAFGVAHIPQAVDEDLAAARRGIDREVAVAYLTDNIQFELDYLKRVSLDIFWEKLRDLRRNPG
jgi:chorismate dehydratase